MEIAFLYTGTVGAERGAEQPENRVERSGERVLQKNDGAERSRGSRSGNGAESRGYMIRLERGAAFLPAPLTCSDYITMPTTQNIIMPNRQQIGLTENGSFLSVQRKTGHMSPVFDQTHVSNSCLAVSPAADDPRQHFCLDGHDTICRQQTIYICVNQFIFMLINLHIMLNNNIQIETNSYSFYF